MTGKSSVMETDGKPVRVGKYLVAQKLDYTIAERAAYQVVSRDGDVLGVLAYYALWRGYVFQPDDNSEFSGGCLRALADFMGTLKGER